MSIATVASVMGTAYARNADGELREIQPGDQLLEGETVVTPDGSVVELTMSDGTPLMVADMPEMTLTQDLMAETATTREEAEITDETALAVLEALEGEGDLGDVLEATAAGLGGAGGPGGGSSFIRLGRIAEETSEFSGIAGSEGAVPAAFGDPAPEVIDAIDDFETTEQGEPVTIVVEANDVAPNGSDVISITQPSNGVAVLNADDTVTYTPNPDFVGTDTLTYTISSPEGIAIDSAVVTIVIDAAPPAPAPEPEPEPEPTPVPEPPVEIRIDDVTVTEGEIAVQTVSLSRASDEDITLNFTTFDGTATVDGGDYNADAGVLLIPAGTTEVTISTQTNVDAIVEGSENYLVELSDASDGVIVDDTGVVTIVDTPVITINDVTVVEGDTASLVISLSTASESPVTVDFESADGTAISGADYDPDSGTITFAPGVTEAQVSFSTTDDEAVESTEAFVVNLSNASGAVIGDAQGVVTILDNDVPPPPPPPPGAPVAEDTTVVVNEAALDLVADGADLAPGTVEGSNPESTAETFTGQLSATDPDGDALTYGAGLQEGDYGTLQINADGSFVYTLTVPFTNTPANDGVQTIEGVESFQFTVSDGALTDTGTIRIDVIDDVPTARLFEGNFDDERIEVGSLQLIVDETPGLDTDNDGLIEDTDAPQVSSADFSILFANDTDSSTVSTADDVDFGADGPGSVQYALSVSAGGGNDGESAAGIPSGLYAVAEGGGKGEQIGLFNDGGNVVGRAGGDQYFTISVDADTGVIELAQTGLSIWHPIGANANDDEVVSLTGVGVTNDREITVEFSIDLTQTVTDKDGDTSEESYNLMELQSSEQFGDVNAFSFSDDGPLAVADEASVGQIGGTIVIDDAQSGVLANDEGGADKIANIVGVRAAGQDTTSDASGGVGDAISGNFGTLTLDPDGRYTYQSNTNRESADVEDTFVYTIQDGDGDLSTTTLTIDLSGDPLTAETGEVTVNDAGLTGGTDPSAPVTASGTVSVSGGTSGYTYEILSPAGAVSNGLGIVSVDDANGSFELNTSNGDFTYTLTSAFSHDADPVNALGDFTIGVTDALGNTVETTVTVNVTDDAPQLAADEDSVASGSAGPAAGNVLTGGNDGRDDNLTDGVADNLGADGGVVVGVVAGADAATDTENVDSVSPDGVLNPVVGEFGSLTIQADGTYTYTRDLSINAPNNETDTFVYTVKDGDGDLESTTLTITIANNSVDLDLPVAVGTNQTSVDEAGLAATTSARANESEGTAANENGELSEGNTFIYTAPDLPVEITIGGVKVIDLDGVGGSKISATPSVTTALGVLTVTGFTAGTVNYSYELLDNADHSGGAVSDSFEVVVTDVDGDSDTGFLDVGIINDAPLAGDVLTSVDEDESVDIAADVTAGADDAEVTAINGETLVFAGDISEAIETGDGDSTPDGSVVYNRSTGLFTYTPVPQFPEAGDAQDSFTYTVTDGDGDTDTGDVIIDVTAVPDAPTGDLNVTANSVRNTNTQPLELPQNNFPGIGASQGDNVINGSPGVTYNEEFTLRIEDLPETFANQVVILNLTAQVEGTWNYDAEGAYFDDRWSIQVNGEDVARFFYNATLNESDATQQIVIPANAPVEEFIFGTAANPQNDSIPEITQTIQLAVQLDENSSAEVRFGAATTQTSEAVQLSVDGLAPLPDTLEYTLDLNAALQGDTFDGSESLEIRIQGVPSDAILSSADSRLTVFKDSDENDGTSIWTLQSSEAPLEGGELILEINQEAQGNGDFADPEFTLELFTVAREESNNDTAEAGPYIVRVSGQDVDPVGLQPSSAPMTKFTAAAEDSLLGTDGDDVFAFSLSDGGDAPANVTISDFGESGTDSLDLRDLLVGEEATDDLSAYLNISLSEDGADTVIEVSTSGAFQGGDSDSALVDQTITLEGVDLVSGADDVNTIIQTMIDSGTLTIDS
ncbi:retention module-containing protein [Parahalioglobus pacificus]|uniref:Outer membrane adhesin-like protein n=1 Tax=Parahalioglobus pacificus TaxID=930806 RepID=A0A918XBP0_9GAMM|nr:retention module-containing protein [Halioglobus pacificus]GHD25163.1 outer membrane adhesin-like protein [Halioglobus pacificus]